jgi:uncharacterized protein YcbK (DUF882 family)
LKAERPRKASGEGRALLAALFAVFLASCTTSDPATQMSSPGYNMTGTDIAADSTDSAAATSSSVVMSPEGDTTLPEQVAYLPVMKPGTEFAAVTPAAEAVANPVTPATETAAAVERATDKQQAATTQQSPAPQQATTEAASASANQEPKVEQDAATAAIPVPTSKDAAPEDKKQVIVTSMNPAAAAPIAPKKRSFLSAFFGSSPAAAAPAKKPAAFAQLASTAPAKSEKAKPLVQLASASKEDAKPLAVRASLTGGGYDDNALPGVRQTALFEIKRKSGIDDDSDVDLHEDEMDGPVQLASAAGLARLAPNGLLTQTERVDVACLKPSLVRVLKTVERHYGRKIIVTSGYRSPAHNRRARGAKNSLHMYCAAADVQVAGVSKWELANFARAMPGRGGIGTYCHTESVHIDVGPERDWNWRCRRRK